MLAAGGHPPAVGMDAGIPVSAPRMSHKPAGVQGTQVRYLGKLERFFPGTLTLPALDALPDRIPYGIKEPLCAQLGRTFHIRLRGVLQESKLRKHQIK